MSLIYSVLKYKMNKSNYTPQIIHYDFMLRTYNHIKFWKTLLSASDYFQFNFKTLTFLSLQHLLYDLCEKCAD